MLDGYTLNTIANPNTPPLAASFGTLDAQGVAAAGFAVPAGAATTLAGTSAHHAAAVIDLLGGGVVFVTNAVEVQFPP